MFFLDHFFVYYLLGIFKSGIALRNRIDSNCTHIFEGKYCFVAVFNSCSYLNSLINSY